MHFDKRYFIKPSACDGILIKVFGACKIIENDIGLSYDYLIWFWKIDKMHMVDDYRRMYLFSIKVYSIFEWYLHMKVNGFYT